MAFNLLVTTLLRVLNQLITKKNHVYIFFFRNFISAAILCSCPRKCALNSFRTMCNWIDID